MKIDLKKSGGDFLSVNTFPPKLKTVVFDLSVLNVTQKFIFPVWGLKPWDSA
jgi:hypothetical protein